MVTTTSKVLLYLLSLCLITLAGCGATGDDVPATAAAEFTAAQLTGAADTPVPDTPAPEADDTTTEAVATVALTQEALDSAPRTAATAAGPTPTRFVFPSNIQATSVCRDSPRTRLILNERARVTDEDQRFLNVRSGPGVDYEAIGQLSVGQIFMVVDGPQCGGEYTWYFINYKGVEGWIAEGEADLYYVEPYLPG